MKTIRLPIPPSVNAAYANVAGKGRVKTTAYRQWEKNADGEALAAGLFSGRRQSAAKGATIVLRLPLGIRGDVDNRIKPLLDYLVSRQFTCDDSTHQSVTARRDPSLRRATNYCEVDIYGPEDAVPAAGMGWVGGTNAT
jgi:Holliday junction resolvase RusA-like endonuclease